MKTHFQIENKEFADFLKLSTNGKSYYFQDDLTIEFDDCEKLNIDIEYVRAEEYARFKTKNPFLRLLQNIAVWFISPLVFIADNDGGIHLDNGYGSFSPFTYKKSFSIKPQNENRIYINYNKAEYDKITKEYLEPSLKLKGDGVVEKNEESVFLSDTLKQEWNTYHIPSFTILLLVVLLLNVIDFSIFAKIIREIPLYPMAENIGGIIGMSFSSMVMIALLVAYIVIIVKAYRLKKEVIDKNK